MRALSFTPHKLMVAKTTRMKLEPAKVENGKGTSPARYATAVAADTTDVAAKSSRRRTAPTRASFLEDTLRLIFPLVEHDNTFSKKVTHSKAYGVLLVGKADTSSSIMGRHRNKVRVAINKEIGELVDVFNKRRSRREKDTY